MIPTSSLPPPLSMDGPRGPAPVSPRGRAWGAYIAWGVIVLVTIAMPVLQHFDARNPSPDAAKAPPRIDVQTSLSGKYTLGAAKASPQATQSLLDQFTQQVRTPAQQIASGVLHGELRGKYEAIERLRAAQPVEETGAFLRLYDNGTPLPDDVRTRYGFFARLAMVHDRSDDDPDRAAVLAEAQRTLFVFVGVGVVLLLLAGIGLCLLVTAIVLLAMRILHPLFTGPTGPARVYAEAFAIYLGGFVVLSAVVQLAVPDAPLFMRALPLVTAVAGGMIWPRLRGVPWHITRRDWGITAGRNVFAEILCGIGGYVAGLPILALGLILSYLLMQVSGVKATHPIVDVVSQNPALLLSLAVVFAPVTEEILFRGALFAHLRSRLGAVSSGLIVGLIFAAVHPQGWAAIPVLGSIGFVLSMIRQWRGSLIGPMAAHALNNGCVLAFVLLVA